MGQEARPGASAARIAARIGVVFAIVAGAACGGCASLGYYAHVTRGQLALLARREPIAAIIADPARDATLRSRLAHAAHARDFASGVLGLPRNGSYRSYVDLGRPYVTWNVFAAAEFSVEPRTRCFLFAGCVAYLGFFDVARAEREAKRLADAGDDTEVEGAAAYSTLGWFADPILSSMLRWSDDDLDGVIFHELAHQKIYVRDDTAFNESYASFVQQEGLAEWRASRGLPRVAEEDSRDTEFTRLVLDLRDRLRAVYASGGTPQAMREAKRVQIAAFRERYRSLRDTAWHGDARYDAWVQHPINNASLLAFGLYDRWVPAFTALFRAVDGRWGTFYRRVEALAAMRAAGREAALAALCGPPPGGTERKER